MGTYPEWKKFVDLNLFKPEVFDNGETVCIDAHLIPRELLDQHQEWESSTGRIATSDTVRNVARRVDLYWRPRGTTWLAVTQRALLARRAEGPSDFVSQLCAELGVEGGERTILAEIAKLKAKIDDRVAWDKRLKDGSVTCKGSMRLSTGCGQCVRCKEEVLTLIAKNTELENERNTLRARLDAATKALSSVQYCVEDCAADVRKIVGLT